MLQYIDIYWYCKSLKSYIVFPTIRGTSFTMLFTYFHTNFAAFELSIPINNMNYE